MIKVQCLTYQSQRALQTNGKLFLNFEFVFELMAKNQITIKTNSEESRLTKVLCTCYMSMDLPRQALQKLMESFFSNFIIIFELATIY